MSSQGRSRIWGGEFADIQFGTEASFTINDRYTIDAVVTGSDPNGNDFFSYQVNPLESVKVTIFASISDEMAETLEHAKLEWKFTDQLNAYYRDDFCTHVYTVNLS